MNKFGSLIFKMKRRKNNLKIYNKLLSPRKNSQIIFLKIN